MSTFSEDLLDHVLDKVEAGELDVLDALDSSVDLFTSLMLGLSKEYEDPENFIDQVLKGVNTHVKKISKSQRMH